MGDLGKPGLQDKGVMQRSGKRILLTLGGTLAKTLGRKTSTREGPEKGRIPGVFPKGKKKGIEY